MKRLVLVLILVGLIGLVAQDVAAQTKTRVKFARGTSGATVKGAVRGYAFHDYVIGASSGQKITLSLTATASPSVFTVFFPNGDNMDDAAEVNDFGGSLPSSGDYVVRVGMMRSAARRSGSVSNYTLKISVK